MAVSQDRVAAASWDGQVRLIAINGSLLWEKKLQGSVEDVGMSQSGAYIAATSFLYPKGKLYLLDEKGKILWERDVPQSKGVDVGDDGQAVLGSTDGAVRLFARNGAPTWEFKLEKSAWGAWDAAFGSGGIAVGGDDAYVYLLEPSGKTIWKATAGEKSYLYGVAVSDGRVAAASQDWYVYLYEGGKLRWKYRTGGSNYGVAVTQGYVAAGSWDNNIYLLDMDGRLLERHPMAGHVNKLSFSPDRKYLAAGSSDGAVYLFSLS
ncbi:MAG: WD40 repeat domain-containing protein [Euryarchaeota archaeon]|nr:WD40 repeat domain-containing protein [Euryarchaeota archaeon]